jgi:multicomponent Na+:H+ antiporter subunit C
MSAALLYASAGALLLSAGLFVVIVAVDLLRRIVALNVASGGVFLLLVGLAQAGPAAPRDPVAHALVLTGIVVAVSATGVALALARRIDAARLPEDE